MSIRAMLRVWDNSAQRASKLVLMLALADMCNDEDIAFPKVITLERRCRTTRRPTQTMLRELEAAGEIYTHHRTGRTKPNFYMVAVGLTADQCAKRLIHYLDYPDDLAQEIGGLLVEAQAGVDVADALSETKTRQPHVFFSDVRKTMMAERALKTAPQKERALPAAPRGAVLDVKGAENSTHEPMNHKEEPKDNNGGKVNKNELSKSLISFFSETAKIPEPTFSNITEARSANKRWRTPLLAIAELVDFDEERTQALIRWGLDRADSEGWGDKVRAPQSIYGTIQAGVAKKKRADAKAQEQKQQYAEMSQTPRPEPEPLSPEEQALVDLWSVIEPELRAQTSRSVYNQWLKKLKLTDRADGSATILAPNELTVEWLENRLRKTIEQAFSFATDGEVTELHFVTE